MFIKETNDLLQTDHKIDEKVEIEWRNKKKIWKRDFKSKLEQTVMRDFSSSSSQRENIYLNVPLPNFVGRKALLKQIARDFSFPNWKPLNPTVVRILHGPGGIGKTETAIKFANNFLEKFSLVWFIHTESPIQYECDYRNLAQALHLETQKLSFDEIRKKVHQSLECRGHISRPWLLIYDNVETPIEIPIRGGYVLKTTQIKNIWDAPDVFFEIQPFTS